MNSLGVCLTWCSASIPPMHYGSHGPDAPEATAATSTDNIIREEALTLGVVDVKVAAIDDDWSGLRVVWRLSNR
jgi:hypothetical protein